LERRFIEESFPIKEISEESSSEKNISRGHISALHNWRARRPLTASRASIIASLIEYPKSEKEVEQKKNEIIKISKWDNSLDQNLICKIKKEIYSSNNNNYPKILDPFSGGGSISLESLRLGCDVSSLDYNPVAVLIEKCTLEFPIEFNNLKNNPSIHNLKSDQLLKDVKKWSDWVISEAEKELKCTYQTKPDEIPIGFIWAKTIQCQNPNCKCEIPLIRQYWLAKKPNKKISLIPKIKNNTIDYEIIQEENGEFPNKFNPSIGSISKAIATCLICKSTIDGKTVRELFKKGDSSERMIAVVYYTNKSKGKQYRICEKEDVDVFKNLKKNWQKK